MLSYILIVMWIVVGVVFLCYMIAHTLNYLDQLDSMSSSFLMSSGWDAYMNYYFATAFILYLGITIFAFLLAYGTFLKKSWSWLIGIMLSSFLGFFAYTGIQTIGTYFFMDRWDTAFSSLYSALAIISYIVMIIVVPCLLFILLRHEIKAYFGKT